MHARNRHVHRRSVSILCAMSFLVSVAACASAAKGGRLRTVGEQHNDGVRYVLEHMESIPPRAELPGRITSLTREYCASIGRQCAASVPYPSFPLDAERVIAASPGSEEFKRSLRALFEAGRSAPNLQAYLGATGVIERNAAARLASPERERFSDIASIARSSARLWAPTSEGGRNGGGTKLPPTGGAAQQDIDWNAVAEADAMGCLVTIEIGCFEGAVAFSAANIIGQLLG